MDELLDRFLELPPRQRVLLVVGSVAFIFFLYAYFLFWPRGTMIAEREQMREDLQKDRDRKAVMVANIDKTRQEVALLEGDLKTAAAQLPTTKEIPDLLSNISSLGRESGLEIMQFKQRAEQFQDFYAEVPVDILVRGSYHQVEAFFGKVGNMARIVNVGDVAIKTPLTKQDPDAMLLDTACAAVTFRFLDDAERERIAKQKEKEQKDKGGKP